MTVSTAYSVLSFTGNGATTAFAVSWPFFTGTLVVTLVSSAGAETVQTLTTHYTVSGGTDSNGLPATGTVTMLTAPASGETLRITRATTKTQASTWSENDGFPQKTVEAALDKLTLLAQEGASPGTVNDGIGGDVMELVSSGATDYWDAESQIIRNVATATAATDAVNYALLQSEMASAGAGNVVGPVSAVDDRIATFDGITGKIIQDGGVTIRYMLGAFNVMAYGATNDGTTDDTAAIQAAVAAAKAAGGGVVFFPGGTGYKITASITIDFGKVAIMGPAAGRSAYIIAPNAVNAFVFSHATPNTTSLGDIGIHNLTIWGPTGPTSGVGIKLIRCTRVYVSNLDLRAFFQGIQIEGGNEQFYSNVTLGGAVWSGAAAGSFLIKLMTHAGSGETPSEVFVSNFNFKGTSGTPYLENAIVLECCDGLFMANGHVGFASNAGMQILGTGASTSIVNIDLSNVMFDGNAGDGGYGIRTGGSSGGTLRELKFTGCTFVGHEYDGIEIGLAAMTQVNFTGCKFSSNDEWGIQITAGTGIVIGSCTFYDNNAANGTGGDISLDGVTNAVVNGNTCHKGTYDQTYCILIGAGSNDQIAIVNNSLVPGATSTAIQINSTVDDLRLENNPTSASDTIASANPLPIPNAGDNFHVSGTTNFSTITAPAAVGRVVTLVFDGALTVTSGASLDVKGAFLSAANSTLTLINDGTIWREIGRTPAVCKSAVASIPAAATAGHLWFATDGRKNGEGAGLGTGVLCFDDGTAWRACDTGATVAA